MVLPLELVLSEDDPLLDLPEEDRWAAGIYGKTREVSSSLREGVSETLVLLAVHGNTLFRDRLGHDLENEIALLIVSLLKPLTTRALEAQSGDLPAYAEAAPEALLQVLEEDLDSSNPQSIGLMRPAGTGVFGRNPRTGLLWALEAISWSPKFLTRVVRILAVLAQPALNDNWANKPTASLSAIFRWWMPQTLAPVEARIAALEYLVREHPKIAWPLCVEQFDGRSSVGLYSYKPRWRTDAHGAGEVVTRGEANKCALRALEIAVNWKTHDSGTLGHLVSCVEHLPDEFKDSIWTLIETWSRTANEDEKAVLREKIRVSAFTRRAKKNKKKSAEPGSRAREAYHLLEPNDVIIWHEWLFKKQWIEESLDELDDEDYDYKQQAAKVETLRLEALKRILSDRGLDGILDLAGRGETSNLIGWLLSKILVERQEVLNLGAAILALGLTDSRVRQSVTSGLMQGLANTGRAELIPLLVGTARASEVVPLLLQAPIAKMTWDLVETLDAASQQAYWKDVNPQLSRGEELDQLQYAVEHLIGLGRPKAAFIYVQYDLKVVPPKLLFRLITAIVTSSAEPAGTYQLDSYHLSEAFKLLTDSGEISVDQMAGMEFHYIEAFSQEECRIPNLEKHIEANPVLFVQAVAMAYKRSDGGEDPEDFRAPNQRVLEYRALAAHRLLDKLSSIPGHESHGELDPDRIEEWVQKVRASAEELS